jgi:divalent metal cation (Fe/Co/Zn/Cd) transporter
MTAPGAIVTDWTRVGLWLVAATLVYNVLEAVVALASGTVAGSIALLGFGLDSVIECVAAGVLLWRLRVEARGAEPEVVERAERRVHRVLGATFLALAVYVTIQALATLWRAEAPDESVVGIVLAAASLVVMPLVAWGKLRAAREMGSAALRAEARETLACSYLSLALLLGLVANAVAGWWWADPAAALAMVPWLVKEGREGLRGDSCADDEADGGCPDQASLAARAMGRRKKTRTSRPERSR